MRSALATDVPPYFCTIKFVILLPFQGTKRACAFLLPPVETAEQFHYIYESYGKFIIKMQEVQGSSMGNHLDSHQNNKINLSHFATFLFYDGSIELKLHNFIQLLHI